MTSATALRTQLNRYMQMLNVIDYETGSQHRQFRYFRYVNKRIPSNTEIHFFIYQTHKGVDRGHNRPRWFVMSYRTNAANSIVHYYSSVDKRIAWNIGSTFLKYKYAYSI